MKNITNTANGASDAAATGAELISDGSQFLGKTVNEIMLWVGKITIFEWILILFILIIGFILLYLKAQVKKNMNPHKRYY